MDDNIIHKKLCGSCKTTSKSNAQIIIKMDSLSSGINGITYTYKNQVGVNLQMYH